MDLGGSAPPLMSVPDAVALLTSTVMSGVAQVMVLLKVRPSAHQPPWAESRRMSLDAAVTYVLGAKL